MRYVYMIGYRDDSIGGMFIPVYNTLDKTEAFIIAPKVKASFEDAEDFDKWFILEYPIDTTLINKSFGWVDYILKHF